MQLEELKQIKDSLDKGVMIHKGKWIEVLEWAIKVTKRHEGAKVAPMTAEHFERIRSQISSGVGIPNVSDIRFITDSEIKR